MAGTRNAEVVPALAPQTGLEYLKAWYATDPDRQFRTADELVQEWATVEEPAAA